MACQIVSGIQQRCKTGSKDREPNGYARMEGEEKSRT